jgi:hypothetical protein
MSQLYQSIKRSLATLWVGEQIQEHAPLPERKRFRDRRTLGVEPHPNGPMSSVRYKQDGIYNRHGDKNRTRMDPTGGLFAVVFNPIDGVIIVQEAISLAQAYFTANGHHMDPNDLPKLRELSDVIFHHWRRMRTMYQNDPPTTYGLSYYKEANPEIELTTTDFRGHMQNWLNYIVVQNIRGVDAVSILEVCLSSRGIRIEEKPSWDRRQTFGIGSWHLYALLATEENSWIAWLLAQHKGFSEAGLGNKCLSSVTIWWGRPSQYAAKHCCIPAQVFAGATQQFESAG